MVVGSRPLPTLRHGYSYSIPQTELWSRCISRVHMHTVGRRNLNLQPASDKPAIPRCKNKANQSCRTSWEDRLPSDERSGAPPTLQIVWLEFRFQHQNNFCASIVCVDQKWGRHFNLTTSDKLLFILPEKWHSFLKAQAVSWGKAAFSMHLIPFKSRPDPRCSTNESFSHTNSSSTLELSRASSWRKGKISQH
jgi:hypothetical protein